MRKVTVIDKIYVGNAKYQITERPGAMFHSFGVDYEEFENGPGTYSVAIVEWPDGTIETVRADRIRFDEKIGGYTE